MLSLPTDLDRHTHSVWSALESQLTGSRLFGSGFQDRVFDITIPEQRWLAVSELDSMTPSTLVAP